MGGPTGRSSGMHRFIGPWNAPNDVIRPCNAQGMYTGLGYTALVGLYTQGTGYTALHQGRYQYIDVENTINRVAVK